MTSTASSVQARWAVINGLRCWADGAATDQAAVELLMGLGARFIHPGRPWIRPCRRRGWFWLDPDPLSQYAGRLSEHDRRVLSLVVTLLTEEPAALPSTGINRQLVSWRAA